MAHKVIKTWISAVIFRYQRFHKVWIRLDKAKRKSIGIQIYLVRRHYKIQIQTKQITEQHHYIKMWRQIIPLENQQETLRIELTARCRQIMSFRPWLEPITVHNMEVKKHRFYSPKDQHLVMLANTRWNRNNSLKMRNLSMQSIIKLDQHSSAIRIKSRDKAQKWERMYHQLEMESNQIHTMPGNQRHHNQVE